MCRCADGSQEAPHAEGFVVSREVHQVQPGDVPAIKTALDTAGKTITFKVGEIDEDRVELVNPLDRNHVAIVIPLAAGMEPLNPALATAPPEATPTGETTLAPSYVAFLDDHVAYFYDTLPKGTYRFDFRTRAQIPGTFIQPAAYAEMMYDGSVNGNSSGAHGRRSTRRRCAVDLPPLASEPAAAPRRHRLQSLRGCSPGGWSGARALVGAGADADPARPQGGFMAQIAAPDDAGYGYWEIADVPPRVVAATLALEDRRFWWHPGVDPVAVARAVWQNLASGDRVSGASTIAMQVARMQDPAPRNYLNKAREAATALVLTLRYGRDAVLRQYLKLVPYGNGSHGIAHAARFYFDKPVADLSWAEIAFLAAIPQAPSRMNPLLLDGRADAIARGHRILDALQERRVITETEHALGRRRSSTTCRCSTAAPGRRMRCTRSSICSA